MIKSFKSKALEAFFYDGEKKKIQAEHANRLSLILDLLNAAASPNDMNFPGSGFHPLKGDKKGEYAVKVSGNWRITFQFDSGDAYDVDYLDYH